MLIFWGPTKMPQMTWVPLISGVFQHVATSPWPWLEWRSAL